MARLPVIAGSERPLKLLYIARTNAGWIAAAFDLLRHGVHSLAFDKSALVRVRVRLRMCMGMRREQRQSTAISHAMLSAGMLT